MSGWQWISLLVIAAYGARTAIGALAPQAIPRFITGIFQGALMTLGLFGVTWVSPLQLVLGLVVGVLYLPIMAALTSPSMTFFLSFNFRLKKWITSLADGGDRQGVILLLALREELIWRSAFFLLMRTLNILDTVTLFCGAFLFWTFHLRVKEKPIAVMVELELLLFSLALGLAYMSTGSILLGWGMHTVRNSYLKFLRSAAIHA